MRRPPFIKTTVQIKAEVSLLEALSQVNMAVRAFKKRSHDLEPIHPIDRNYMRMNCIISNLKFDDPQYKVFLMMKCVYQLSYKRFGEVIKE